MLVKLYFIHHKEVYYFQIHIFLNRIIIYYPIITHPIMLFRCLNILGIFLSIFHYIN